MSLAVDATDTSVISFTPAGATNKHVTITTSNAEVATFTYDPATSTITVKKVATGTATITVASDVPGVEAVTITVSNAA